MPCLTKKGGDRMNIEYLLLNMDIEKMEMLLAKYKKCAWERNCINCLTLAMKLQERLETLENEG